MIIRQRKIHLVLWIGLIIIITVLLTLSKFY